jgi:hypothetical protein
MNISSENKVEGKIHTYGETQQGNINNPPTFGQYVNSDGSMGIKEATITIFEGTINAGVKTGSGSKYEGLTVDQAIGAVAGHEIVHATDKAEINKELQETQGKPRKDNRETKPDQVDKKIIDQSKKLNE